MKLPCDICMWGLIPMIKRELVLNLYQDHNINKTSISVKLGITKGSVTQYIQGKRASDSGKLRKLKQIDSLIKKLAKLIATKKLSKKDIAQKFCQICKSAQKETGIC